MKTFNSLLNPIKLIFLIIALYPGFIKIEEPYLFHIKFLALTENSFIEYKNKAKKENITKLASYLARNLKIKFVVFFILDLILLVFFWFYLSCFSAVYKNTQIHLIKDTLISFGTSFISPFAIYLLHIIFIIPYLKNKNMKILYEINQVLQLL